MRKKVLVFSAVFVMAVAALFAGFGRVSLRADSGEWNPWSCKDFTDMSDQNQYVWAHGYATSAWSGGFDTDNVGDLVAGIDEACKDNPDSSLIDTAAGVADDLTEK